MDESDALADQMHRQLLAKVQQMINDSIASFFGTFVRGGKLQATALPAPSGTALGGVKAGTGITISSDGTISATSGGGTVTSVTGTAPVSVSNPTTTPNVSVAVMRASGASHAAGLVGDPGGTAGSTKFWREDATWAVPAGGGGGTLGYINIQDQKASGTDGGTFTSGGWRTRDLNTIQADTTGAVTVSANQIHLPAGTYRCRIHAPCVASDRTQARLQNITDGTTILPGESLFNNSAVVMQVDDVIAGRFTIAVTKVIEVQHQCQTTRATNGFGAQAGAAFTVPFEVYTVAEFWKE